MLFLLDGLYFWMVLAAFGIMTIGTIEYELGGWSTAMLAIVLLFLQFYSSYKPLFFAIHFPVYAVTALALYFALGAGWIVLKWTSHVYSVRDRAKEVVERRKALCVGCSISDVAREIGVSRLPLQVSDHKKLLYIWWLWWPLSLFWTICDDPLRRLGHFVYNQLGQLLQTISDNAFKNVDESKNNPD